MISRVTTPLTLGPGTRLLLTEAQAAARRHLLQPIGKSSGGRAEFEALAAVQFKVGEEIGLVGEPPKATLHAIEVPAGHRRAAGKGARSATLSAAGSTEAATGMGGQSAAAQATDTQ